MELKVEWLRGEWVWRSSVKRTLGVWPHAGRLRHLPQHVSPTIQTTHAVASFIFWKNELLFASASVAAYSIHKLISGFISHWFIDLIW